MGGRNANITTSPSRERWRQYCKYDRMVNKLLLTILIIICALTITAFVDKVSTIPTDYHVKRDTIIKDARLIDTISEEIIWRHPNHMALLVRFQANNSLGATDSINVLIYAPEYYGKDFFKLNRRYRIYGSTDLGRIVFTSIGDFREHELMIRCDSIKSLN